MGGATTKDPEFAELERNFNDLKNMSERLNGDAKRYRDAMNAMLNHQASFANHLNGVYDPLLGESYLGDGAVKRREQPDYSENMKAVQHFEQIMQEVRDAISPEVEQIDRRVVQPTEEFQQILKGVEKLITKHHHKLVDYDRHRNALEKLQNKKDRSISDEKSMYKTEGLLATATEEYEYYNNLLKHDLPYLFHYKSQFIEPIFETFYFMQSRIFSLLLQRMDALVQSGFFKTMDRPTVEAFEQIREETQVKETLEDLELLKSKGYLRPSAAAGYSRTGATPSPPASPTVSTSGVKHTAYAPSHASSTSPTDSLPPYTPGSGKSSVSRAPPPVAHKPTPLSQPAATYCVALYDYDAQAEGDLSFRKDDKIEIIERTADENDWWTGKLHGRQGVFPGNYVAILQ
ncbi:hypothetical protein BZG36_01003 [Bifiguratus adelaidae]|uniref:BAR domain-containing protein n=1 Tax=Bifiguratus adelaidae TaxID=1938954 RepID=A0A261Y6F4_9FUNG|nr:hypothetical protein BZG36_01003 [Bifiguratus adelaidae]